MENQKTTTKSPVESEALNFLTSDDAVSSQQQNASDLIQRAEGVRDRGVQAANAQRDAQQAGIDNTFNRDLNSLNLNQQSARRTFAQGSSMGTSSAQYKLLNDTITRNLGDLQARKEEARLNADANHFAQLQGLEANYLEQQQQATQQLFNNMLGIAGIEQQQQSFRLNERQQEFAERSAIGDVALQFGLEVQEGDTIDSIVERAAPEVQENIRRIRESDDLTKEQQRQQIKNAQLDFERIKADIQRSRAQTAQIAAARNDRKKMESFLSGLSEQDTLSLYASGQLTTDDLLKTGQADKLSAVANYERQFLKADAADAIQSMRDENVPESDIQETLSKTNPYLSPAEVSELMIQTRPEETVRRKGLLSHGFDELKNPITTPGKIIGLSYPGQIIQGTAKGLEFAGDIIPQL